MLSHQTGKDVDEVHRHLKETLKEKRQSHFRKSLVRNARKTREKEHGPEDKKGQANARQNARPSLRNNRHYPAARRTILIDGKKLARNAAGEVGEGGEKRTRETGHSRRSGCAAMDTKRGSGGSRPPKKTCAERAETDAFNSKIFRWGGIGSHSGMGAQSITRPSSAGRF